MQDKSNIEFRLMVLVLCSILSFHSQLKYMWIEENLLYLSFLERDSKLNFKETHQLEKGCEICKFF